MHRTLVLLAGGWVGLAAQTNDQVVLTNAPPGNVNQLVVWGKFSLFNYYQEFSNQPPTIDLGANVLACPKLPFTCHSDETVAFTQGRAPISRKQAWTSGLDSVSMSYPNEVVLRVKAWVLCQDDSCGTPLTTAYRDNIVDKVADAATLFLNQNAGIQLDLSAVDAIRDETANPKKNTYRDFPSSCSGLGSLVKDMIDENAMNMYIVWKVNGETTRGESCLKPNVAVLGYQFSAGLLAHELGHGHGLKHYFGGRGEKNIMYPDSSARQYLSEGEVYRMHFLNSSVMNRSMTGYSQARAPRPNEMRPCSLLDFKNPCPDMEVRLWDDPQ